MLCSLLTLAQTQTTGAIQGNVYEIGTNLPVTGATVVVTHETKGYSRTTITNVDGIYFMANLESGYYTITASREGYDSDASSTTNGFAIRITKTGLVVPPPIGLRKKGVPPPPPTPSPPPDVDSRDEQLINTTNATRGANFDRRQLTALPLSGIRTFDSLAFLVPGVAPAPQSIGDTVGPGIGSGVGTSGQFVVNGLRSRSNNFTIDGSDNNDEDIGVRRQGFTSLVPQSIESLQEFQIATLLAEPQFGRNLAAQVNAVSRTGGKDYHGAFYGFFTDKRLNARNFFDSTGGPSNYPLVSNGKPVMIERLDENRQTVDRRQLAPSNPVGEENPFTRAQYGLVFGGPMPVDRKTFFFVSFEQQRTNASKESHFAVPTIAERGLYGSGDKGLGMITGPSFPTSEVGDAFFSLFPFPNNPIGPYGANTFTEVLPANARGTIFSVKMDREVKFLGRQHTITGRYNLTDDNTILPVTGEALFSSLRPLIRAQNLSLLLNSALSTSLANQLRFSYGRTHLEFEEVRNSFLLPSRRFPDERFLLNAPLVENFTLPGGEPIFKIIPDDTENAPLLRVPVFEDGQFVGDLRPGVGPLGQVRVSGYSPIGVDVLNFPQARTNNTFQYADTFIYNRRKQRITGGFDIRRTQLNSNLERNFRPLAVFSGARNLLKDLSPEAQEELNQRLGTTTQEFNLGRDLVAVGAPTGFFQTQAIVPDATIGLRYLQTNFFLADQIRLHPNLTLTLGLRYELNTVPSEVNHRIEETFSDPQILQIPELARIQFGRAQIYRKDINNLAPHVAFAWDPFGHGKTALRAGYGVYYDQILGAVVSQSRSVFPSFLTVDFAGVTASIVDRSLQIANGLGFISPVDLANPQTFNTYQQALGPPSEFVLRLNSAFSGIAAGAAGVTFVLPADDLQTPFAQHWGLTLDQELKRDFFFALAYVGTRGNHLLRFATPNLGPNSIPVVRSVFISPVSHQPGFQGDVVAPGLGRPAPSLGSYTLIVSDSNSIYHSLQAQLNKRFSRGIQFTTAYTWSHAIDEVSDLFSLAGDRAVAQNIANRRDERGDANFDVRHRFVASTIWELPLFRKKKILGGWQVAGIGTLQTGQPYSIYFFSDSNLDGNLADRIIPLGDGTVLQGSGRNNFRARGIASVDLAINKKFQLRGQQSIEFRAEFFNLFNRTHFGIPVNEFLFPSFGNPVNTRIPARTIQFALKYNF